MAPPYDPALGLTGTLTAVQGLPSMPAAPGATSMPQDTGAGSQSLERAARSLESVQGNVSGQTQAIQQMTMAAQQQSTNMQMLITQLSMQVAGLSQSIGSLSTAMSLSAPAMSAMSQPVPMSSPMGGGFDVRGGLAAAGGLAMRGGQAAFSGLHAFGRPFGAMGEAVVSPFFGTPVAAPGPGQIAPNMSQDVGFMRGAAMAGGWGLDPRMFRTAGAGRLQELGQERMQQRFADMALGMTGGAARVGTGLAMDSAGMGIAGALGFGGGLTGMVAGGLIGAGLAVPAGLAIDETMGQSAAMRGYGDQFARNAFRMLGPGSMGFGGLRRPGMMQRLRVGQAVNRMEIQDLTLGEQDMRDIMAGMSQEDLARGVRSTDEVVQRFRETKETIKLLGRRMGQTVQEAAGTMGALQELGFDPTGQRGRAAIFGASSVTGMTGAEAARRTMQMAQGTGAGAMGFGREMMGVSGLSLQAAQGAIQQGALGNIDIAALGGRQGAQEAIQNLVQGYLQSGVGRARLLAGQGARGLGVQQMMRLASQRASTDPNRLVEVEMGGAAQTREFLNDPTAAIGEIYGQVRDLSEVFMGRPGVTRKTAMKMALRQFMPQANDAQLDAVLNTIQAMPQAIQQRQRQMGFEVAGDVSTQTTEQLALMARARRRWRQAFTGPAEAITEAATGAGAAIGRATTGLYRGLTGTDVVAVGGGMDVTALRAMTQRTMGGEDIYAPEALPPEVPATMGREGGAMRAARRAAVERNRVRELQRQTMGSAEMKGAARGEVERIVRNAAGAGLNRQKIESFKDVLKDPKSTQDEKNRAVRGLMSLLSGGMYDQLRVDSRNPRARARALSMRRAFLEAATSAVDIDLNASMLGHVGQATGFGASELRALDERRGEVASLLGLDRTEDADRFATPEIQAYLQDLAAGGTGGGAERAAQEAGQAGQIAEIVGALGGMGEEERSETASQLLGQLFDTGGLSSLRARQRIDTSTRVLGTGFSSVLRRAGLDRGDIGARLTGGTARQRMAAMGRVQKMLHGGDINRLAGVEGGAAFADVLRQFQGVSVGQNDDLDASERKILRDRFKDKIGADKLNDLMDMAQQQGHFGAIISEAMTAKLPEMQVLGRGGTLTEAGAMSIFRFMEETNKLALLVKELQQDIKKGK